MKYEPGKANKIMLPESWYRATILDAEDAISKVKKNPMLHIVFQVYGPGGQKEYIDDYFVNSSQPALSRLKKLCAALKIDFATGEVSPSQFMNRNLRVFVKIQASDGNFDDRNVIAKYAGEEVEEPANVDTGTDTDDDVPF